MSKINASYKHHFLLAIVIAVWLTIFLILIAPFDIAELPIKARLEILPVYGLISFVGYIILMPFQYWIYKRLKKQSISFEILIIALFNIIVWLGSYWYYKSDIVNGDYSFTKFTFEIYYPIFFILLPVIIFGRWFINRKVVQLASPKIILTGDNKLDILQIQEEDLVCISSADNYVEVAYLINNELHKKLLRTTLKNMEVQLPQLMKVHRSHLINPLHFKAWKNANTLLLTQIEVPISKNYKKEILAMDHSPLKANASSQS